MGPALAFDLVRSGEITRVSREIIRPFYQEKARRAVVQLLSGIGSEIPMRIHKPEGALFLWLWFENLPISSRELYARLKKRGVLVVSGHYFFPGMEKDFWPHKEQCIRVTYAQDDKVVERGIAMLADEIRSIYQ